MKLALRKGDQEWNRVWSAEAAGRIEEAISLDAFFQPDSAACYTYDLSVELNATEHSGDVTLDHVSIESDLQMAPLSLPDLEIGENEIPYSAENDGHVQITHSWQEKESDPLPIACQTPEHPGDGETVSGTQFTFSWEPSPDATDYQFQLSSREDMKYTLYPVFDKLISNTPSSGKSEWRIPYVGLLNPGTTYYWKIRPRNAEGLCGDWSPTWAFTPRAPGIPLGVSTTVDWERRTVTLNWQPNPQGDPVDHYEIFGSDERGFTASAKHYEVVTGKGKEPEIFPSNLIGKTSEVSAFVAGPGHDFDQGNKAFYRVIAVDRNGVPSGPSDFAETPRPFITSRPVESASAGKEYRYVMESIRSIGELQCESMESKRYVSAFRGADELRFLLEEGPGWITLDEETGLFAASPRTRDIGTHTVTLRVQNSNGGTDMQGFDLEVKP